MHKTNAEELNEASSWGWHAAHDDDSTRLFSRPHLSGSPHTWFLWISEKARRGLTPLDFSKPLNHPPANALLPDRRYKSLTCSGRVVKIRAWRHFRGVCRLQNRGERMPRLLILHRVHRKGKVAASMTHHRSSASHMEPRLSPLTLLFGCSFLPLPQPWSSGTEVALKAGETMWKDREQRESQWPNKLSSKRMLKKKNVI